MQSKRILNVIYTPSFGGPHNQVLRLAPALSELGWEMITVLPEEPGDGAERLAAHGVEVVRCALRRPRKTLDPATHLRFVSGFRGAVNDLRALIRKYRIDIVQTCGVMNFQAALAARSEGVPVVWQLLSDFAPAAIRRMCMPGVLRLAHVIMTTGRRIAEAHPGATRVPERLVTFVPPVDTAQFRPDPRRRKRAREELRVPGDGILVGTVGNFCQQKAHEVFVEVARLLRASHKRIYFRVLGGSVSTSKAYYDREVRQRAAMYGLLDENILEFISPGPRVAELLPAMDVFLLTSRAEGIPTAILEAAACGVPVVSTNVGAIAEVVYHGKTGFLARPEDTRGLAEAVSRITNDAELHARMSVESRRIAEQHFSLTACAQQHLAAYELALRARGPIIN